MPFRFYLVNTGSVDLDFVDLENKRIQILAVFTLHIVAVFTFARGRGKLWGLWVW